MFPMEIHSGGLYKKFNVIENSKIFDYAWMPTEIRTFYHSMNMCGYFHMHSPFNL